LETRLKVRHTSPSRRVCGSSRALLRDDDDDDDDDRDRSLASSGIRELWGGSLLVVSSAKEREKPRIDCLRSGNKKKAAKEEEEEEEEEEDGEKSILRGEGTRKRTRNKLGFEGWTGGLGGGYWRWRIALHLLSIKKIRGG
jgi:hypothetical protein